MPSKDVNEWLEHILRSMEDDEKRRHYEHIKMFKTRFREQRQEGSISLKLEQGAVHLITEECFLPDKTRIRPYNVTTNSLKSDTKGFQTPNKMFVYREMSRLGLKWNDKINKWEKREKREKKVKTN